MPRVLQNGDGLLRTILMKPYDRAGLRVVGNSWFIESPEWDAQGFW